MTAPNVGQQELRLVSRAVDGDRDAMRVLFETYRDVAFRVAWRITGHEQDALDVVQDGFIKAFCGLAKLQEGSSFKNWFLRIVHNQALDHLRERRVRKAASLDEPGSASGEWISDHRGAAQTRVLGQRETQQRVQQAIDALPPAQRAVFSLYLQGEFTYGDIAEIVGIPIGTVMSRIYHARRQLQHVLRDLGPQGAGEGGT